MIILDSRLCVLKAIISLKKHGVYELEFILKRRYWPKFINCEAIRLYSTEKEVTTQAHLYGKIGGIGFAIFAMRETEYKIMLMSRYEKLVLSEGKK